MSNYFYKENILFGVKIFILLFGFVSYFIVSFRVFKVYYNNFLEFDTITNNMEELYYQSFKTFLQFKYELAEFQTDPSYKIVLPESKEIPNFSLLLS